MNNALQYCCLFTFCRVYKNIGVLPLTLCFISFGMLMPNTLADWYMYKDYRNERTSVFMRRWVIASDEIIGTYHCYDVNTWLETISVKLDDGLSFFGKFLFCLMKKNVKKRR